MSNRDVSAISGGKPAVAPPSPPFTPFTLLGDHDGRHHYGQLRGKLFSHIADDGHGLGAGRRRYLGVNGCRATQHEGANAKPHIVLTILHILNSFCCRLTGTSLEAVIKMLLCIADVITPAALIELRNLYAHGSFQDGRRTAGWHARLVKNNTQLLASPAADAARQSLCATIAANDVFAAACLPARSGPMLFPAMIREWNTAPMWMMP
ncbi:MAG: hypothetical protein ACI82H_001144 [Alphaproteobacteria bacterium]|jgi:hypothetical protein